MDSQTLQNIRLFKSSGPIAVSMAYPEELADILIGMKF